MDQVRSRLKFQSCVPVECVTRLLRVVCHSDYVESRVVPYVSRRCLLFLWQVPVRPDFDEWPVETHGGVPCLVAADT